MKNLFPGPWLALLHTILGVAKIIVHDLREPILGPNGKPLDFDEEAETTAQRVLNDKKVDLRHWIRSMLVDEQSGKLYKTQCTEDVLEVACSLLKSIGIQITKDEDTLLIIKPAEIQTRIENMGEIEKIIDELLKRVVITVTATTGVYKLTNVTCQVAVVVVETQSKKFDESTILPSHRNGD